MRRTTLLFITLSSASLTAMTLIDLVLGDAAEFLNAYNALQWLLGFPPPAKPSLIAQHVGPLGELLLAISLNALIGGILTLLVRFVRIR